MKLLFQLLLIASILTNCSSKYGKSISQKQFNKLLFSEEMQKYFNTDHDKNHNYIHRIAQYRDILLTKEGKLVHAPDQLNQPMLESPLELYKQYEVKLPKNSKYRLFEFNEVALYDSIGAYHIVSPPLQSSKKGVYLIQICYWKKESKDGHPYKYYVYTSTIKEATRLKKGWKVEPYKENDFTFERFAAEIINE